MAEQANADSVAADIRPPEYRKAVQLMRHDIDKKKERISKINGEIGAVWGRIEGFKVTKPAGRIFMALDAMEDDERTETLRCLNGLIDAAEWPEPEADLADISQGKRVENRVGPSEGVDEALDDLEAGEEGEESDDPPRRRLSGMEALEGVRERNRQAEEARTAGGAKPH